MSITTRTDDLIDAWIGRTSIIESPHRNGVVSALLHVIEGNWTHQRSTAQKNWMWRQAPLYSKNERQQSEVIIERQIVEAGKPHWANQIPTASGLAGPGQDTRRAVDLAFHHGGREFSLFELKLESDNPWYAAKEILLHGLVYLFTRIHSNELGYAQRGFKLLDADIIHLRVLAPHAYYGASDLSAVEQRVNEELRHYLSKNPSLKLTMDFKFEAFPLDFDYHLVRTTPNAGLLMQAVHARRPLFGVTER
jgi:hypothetical protein